MVQACNLMTKHRSTKACEISQQVKDIVALAQSLELAICFRASGTSLSGQALTDSILISLSDNWKQYSGKYIR